MGRPRKWPGETQAERNLAMDRDRRRRAREGKPDLRRGSKYPGDTPQELNRQRNRAYYQRHAERKRREYAEYRKRPETREVERIRGARYRATLTMWDRRIMNLRGKYKLTVEQFDDMMATQKGKCAICGDTFGIWCMPAVDHCHTTGKVRGILCGFCNRMLGTGNDDPVILATAITYLASPSPELPPEAVCVPYEILPHRQPRTKRELTLRSRYQLTLLGYEHLLALQGNCCRICHKPFGNKRPHIDHNHDAHRVRGLLCRVCNVLLGMARDNPAIILAGIAYLGATSETS